MEKNSKIYIAGHTGLEGSAILRKLQELGYSRIITRTVSELDLRVQPFVNKFFENEKPDYVFMAAAKVGGILANSTFPAEFIYDNLIVQSNVIHASYLSKVKKLLFLGSSCVYPKHSPQPTKEEHLLSGTLEPTNEPYAIAKIAGIKMCQAYNKQYGTHNIPVIPTNLYGPNDDYDPETSHVLPALIRKFMDAKIAGKPCVEIWGTGSPRREFLYVDDLADACMFLMDSYDGSEIVNIGVGQDISIKELAEKISKVVSYKGKFIFDKTKPDGAPRKLLDSSRLNGLGWRARVSLDEGLRKTVEWYKQSVSKAI